MNNTTQYPTFFQLPLLLIVTFFCSLSMAGSGVSLGFSNTLLSAGVYSLYSLEGTDVQGDVSSGFLHTQIEFKSDSNNKISFLDVLGRNWTIHYER